MSALLGRFSNPVLEAHKNLATLLERAESGESLLDLQDEASRQAGAFCYAELGVTAVHRLNRLTGRIWSPSDLETALSSLDAETMRTVQVCTGQPRTWFGTYVANAFGSGLIKSGRDPAAALQLLMRVLAQCSQEYGESGHERSAWCISSRGPALAEEKDFGLAELRFRAARTGVEVLIRE